MVLTQNWKRAVGGLKNQRFCSHRNLLPALRSVRRPKVLTAKQRAKEALFLIMSSQKGVFDYRPFSILQDIIATLPDD
jgi:hypothetical protein